MAPVRNKNDNDASVGTKHFAVKKNYDPRYLLEFIPCIRITMSPLWRFDLLRSTVTVLNFYLIFLITEVYYS